MTERAFPTPENIDQEYIEFDQPRMRKAFAEGWHVESIGLFLRDGKWIASPKLVKRTEEIAL